MSLASIWDAYQTSDSTSQLSDLLLERPKANPEHARTEKTVPASHSSRPEAHQQTEAKPERPNPDRTNANVRPAEEMDRYVVNDIDVISRGISAPRGQIPGKIVILHSVMKSARQISFRVYIPKTTGSFPYARLTRLSKGRIWAALVLSTLSTPENS